MTSPIGIPCLPSDDFYSKVSRGELPGFSYEEKFGEHPAVAAADVNVTIWDGGQYAGAGVYTYSTTADITHMSSSSAADTGKITVVGQALDGVEIAQVVQMAGLSKVELDTPLWRVYRMFVTTGTELVPSVDVAGNVFCYVDTPIVAGVPTDKTKIRALIRDGNNQTLMCVYTVPANRIAYFLGGYTATTKTGANEAVLTWRLREKYGVFRVQSKLAIIGAGSSTWAYRYPIPVGPIPAGADISLIADSVDANGTGVAGGFTLLMQEVQNV